MPYKEILLLILGTLSTFLIWRLQYQKDKLKDIENQLSDRKYKMYSDVIYLLFDIINSSKNNDAISDTAITKRILNIKREMFIYAPDHIFKTFTKWTLELNNPESAVTHFKIYYQMMKLIRKDMGHTSTKIDLDDFMLFLMQNEEEYMKFKQIYNW